MPPRTALGFKLQPWVESNHVFLWISLHFPTAESFRYPCYCTKMSERD